MPADPAHPSPAPLEPLLSVRHLRAGFDTDSGPVVAVEDLSFNVQPGQVLGVVGESGCGKSVTAMSILRLLPHPMGKILGGEVWFGGRDLTKLPLKEMQKIRGAQVSMIFQEPMTALNPTMTVGRQVADMFVIHRAMPKKEAWERAVELLRRVGIPSPEIRAGEYPHQLSGGMRQRVVIAMAIALEPRLIIADEPTTALDVTIQAQILDLLRQLRAETGTAIMLITHDLGVIAEMCDEVLVMYAGRAAERAPAAALFERPSHPYTRGLLSAIPRLEYPRKTRLRTIEGMVPTLHEMPRGCRFQNRCPHFRPACAEDVPPLESVGPNHQAACWRWREAAAEAAAPTPLSA